MRRFCCLPTAVCLLALALPQLVMGQDVILESDAMYDYLLTIADINGTGMAVDPTVDPTFAIINPNDQVSNIALWPFPNYVPAGANSVVNGEVRDTPGTFEAIPWRQAQGPFQYGGVAGVGQGPNGPFPVTDLLADSGLGFTEDQLDGQKLTQYFRTSFTTTEGLSNILIDVLIDDSAVFYIDGFEVARYNCCALLGGAGPETAGTDIGGVGAAPYYDSVTENNGDVGDENTRNNNWDPPWAQGVPNAANLIGFAGGTLPAGDHVLGIEVHSYGTFTSSDLGLDVRLFTIDEDYEFQGPSGSWTNIALWTSGILVPNGVDAEANLLQIPTEETTIYHNGGVTMGQLFIDNANKYAIAGLGTFSFETSGDNAVIDVAQGDHEFQAPVALLNNTDLTIAAGASLEFNNDISGNGNSLNISGGGEVRINNETSDLTVSMAAGAMSGGGSVGGDLVNSGAVLSPGDGVGVMSVIGNFLQSEDGVLAIDLAGIDNYDLLDIQGSAEFGGELSVSLLGGFQPSLGDEFDILNFGSASGSFDSMSLPALEGGLQWDMSNLYVAGNLAVVPEPAGLLLLLCGSFALGLIRRRS